MQPDFVFFLLIAVRIIAMLLTSPIFSLRQIPSFVKVGLSMVIAMIVSSSVKGVPLVTSNLFDLAFYTAKEVLIGVSIGYISTLIFNAVRISAQFMDFQIGFSMSQYYDPSTAGNSTPLERFFNWLATAIFLAFNFHHIILSAIIKSFEVIPVGIYETKLNIFSGVINIFTNSFYLSVQLAAPIVIVLFLTDFTLGLVARTVPQLNIFVLGMPLKVLVGLFAISAILPGLTHIYVKSFEGIYTNLVKYLNLFPFIMLMADDKTEDPTDKKIQDARKKGQIAKSNDLNSAVILLGVTIFFIAFGNTLYTNGRLFIIDSFKFVGKNDLRLNEIISLFIYMLKNGLIAGLPIILTVMLLGVISNIAQTGFLFSSESLKPKLNKLNPLEGIKKFVSKRAFWELVKNIGKIALISYVAYNFIEGKISDILKTSDLNPKGIFSFVKSIADSQLLRLVVVLSILGIADFIIQKRQLKKDLMMTKHEIKEEFKQSEGDPQIKSRIRQKQREMATKRMMHEVPKATVIVTNPTHFAVAIRYENGLDKAPKVVAKGADLVALKIRQIAKDNNVPIIENKPLARTLFAKVEIDDEVPVELYQAVAEIIAYVYSMRKM